MEYLQSVLAVPTQLMDASAMNISSARSNTSRPPVFAISEDLSQVALDVFSSTAVPDWAKLFLLGAVVELCRRLFYSLWTHLLDCPWITVTFDDDDIAFCTLFMNEFAFISALYILTGQIGYCIGCQSTHHGVSLICLRRYSLTHA